jgi:hypothetical protein
MGQESTFERVDEGGPDSFARLRARYLRAAIIVHVGEYMAMLVTSYLVFHKTHSVAATGLILLCYNVPSLLLAEAATALTRRFGALTVDAWMNSAEGAIALVPMALAATHRLSVASLLAWVLAYGVCEGLNAPNSYLVRQLIAAPGKLPELNSAYTRNVAIAAAGGMVLGGAILVLAGPAWVFLVCAVTAVPEVLVFVDASRHQSEARAAQSASESFSDALRLLRTEPGLWAACRFAVLCFFVASYTVTLPAIASTIGSSAVILSLLESGSLVGGILVAVVVKRIHGRVGWGRVQRLCYFAAAAGLAAMATAEYVGGAHSRESGLVALMATVPIGFAVLMNASIVTSVIQIATPLDKRASMFTLLALIPLVVGPVSQEAVGLLADHLSVSAALGIVAAVTMVVNAVVSHRPMSEHFDRLNEAAEPFPVNAMLSQRGARRSHSHLRHGPHPA